jgi:hypothetical protein
MRKFWRRIRWYASFAIIMTIMLVVASSPVRAAMPQFIGQPSANWSGYAAYGNTFRQVQGEITVPRVSCPTAGAEVLFWVGLDGDQANSHTVEQDGVGARCSSSHHPTISYFAWWEMYPGPLEQVNAGNFKIAPGNKIIASIKFQPTSDVFTLSLQNKSTDRVYSTAQQCASGYTCSKQSAEWITERYAINPLERTFRPLAAWTTNGSPCLLVTKRQRLLATQSCARFHILKKIRCT